MTNTRQKDTIGVYARLRTRIAASYVVVTLIIVLLLESVLTGFVFYIVTRSPMAGYFALQTAGHAAQVMALQAAVRANGSDLSADSTFEPDREGTLVLQRENDPPDLSWFNLRIPYLKPGSPAPAQPTFALLIGPDGQVLASSYPHRYPRSSRVPDILPEDAALIRDALAGCTNGAVRETAYGMVVAVANTVWSRDQQPIGAVYVQAPAGSSPRSDLLSDVAAVVLPSGLLWLCMMLPIGMIFGFLTTRDMIRRIERLASATARFRNGDTAIRVPVTRADEIGQLERQFNTMAEQLVANFQERQAMAEQSARREERARIEQEMRSAHYIQRSLLPKALPSMRGWQIESHYSPAQEVGGDLYDFLALPGRQMGIVIGDANGKGIPSALIMATTCAMLRAAAQGANAPGEVLALVNNLLQHRIPPGTFTTCFYARLDLDSGRLCYANAGHNLPYLLRKGEIVELRARGMPLGLMPDQVYEEHEVILVSEDCVLFYTDGLVEAHNADREMFGSHRLKRRLQEQVNGADLSQSLFRDLRAFAGSEWQQEDDVTMVVLRKTCL